MDSQFPTRNDKTIMGPLLHPTRPLPASPTHPLSQPAVHVRVELIELQLRIPGAKVVAPPRSTGFSLAMICFPSFPLCRASVISCTRFRTRFIALGDGHRCV